MHDQTKNLRAKFEIEWRGVTYSIGQLLAPNEKYASLLVPDLLFAWFSSLGLRRYEFRVFYYQTGWIACFDSCRSKRELLLDFYNNVEFNCRELDDFELSPIYVDKFQKG